MAPNKPHGCLMDKNSVKIAAMNKFLKLHLVVIYGIFDFLISDSSARIVGSCVVVEVPNWTYPILIPCTETNPAPIPMLKSILIPASIPNPILIPDPIPSHRQILIPEPISKLIPDSNSGADSRKEFWKLIPDLLDSTKLNLFQKTSELESIPTKTYFFSNH